MPKPPRTPPRDMLPDITVMRFCPMLAMRLSTSAFAPAPMLTPTMTEAMPTMIPSIVRNERRTFRRNARTAILRTPSIVYASWTAFCSASSLAISSAATNRSFTGSSLRTSPSRITTTRRQ